MKIYTVQGMDKIDYDLSVEIRNLGCFYDRAKALQRAAEEFEKLKAYHAYNIEIYSNVEDYPSVDDGGINIEEDTENGYYLISFGFEEWYEVHTVAVDEWTVEE